MVTTYGTKTGRCLQQWQKVEEQTLRGRILGRDPQAPHHHHLGYPTSGQGKQLCTKMPSCYHHRRPPNCIASCNFRLDCPLLYCITSKRAFYENWPRGASWVPFLCKLVAFLPNLVYIARLEIQNNNLSINCLCYRYDKESDQ